MMLSVALRVTLLAMSFIATESPHVNPIQPFKDYVASLPSFSSKINTPDGSKNLNMRMHSLDHLTCSNSNVDFLSNLVDQAIISTLQWSKRVNMDDTKIWSMITTFLVSTTIIDPRYMEHGTTELVDSCSLHKYDLGFPYGLFSDRFFKSSHVPICLAEIIKKNTCVTMFASPIQFFLNLIESENPVYDSFILRSDLDEAFQKWLLEEQEAFKAWLYDVKFELVAILVALLTTVLGKTIFQPSRKNAMEINQMTTAIVLWDGRVTDEEDKTTVDDVEPSFETIEIYETAPAIETLEEDSVQKCLNTFVATPVHSNKEELACGQSFEKSSKPRQVMSSLQANAGIYIDGIFSPYAESSQHNSSSIEDKLHFKLLLSRETKKIMDKHQGDGSMKINIFDALYENRIIPEYDESIYTTALDPNKLSRRQRKLAGKIALEIEDENLQKRRIAAAAAAMEGAGVEAAAEPEDGLGLDEYQ